MTRRPRRQGLKTRRRPALPAAAAAVEGAGGVQEGACSKGEGLVGRGGVSRGWLRGGLEGVDRVEGLQSGRARCSFKVLKRVGRVRGIGQSPGTSELNR